MFWGVRKFWGVRDSLVAPYFFEAEEAAWGGQYGGSCVAGGRAGSGGGWVVEGVVSRDCPTCPICPVCPGMGDGTRGTGRANKNLIKADRFLFWFEDLILKRIKTV